jgi:hypothetical protein
MKGAAPAMAESGGVSGILAAEPEATAEGTVQRRFRERLKAGLQVFVIFVATVIGIGALLIFRNAIEAHSVVIEAFQVPPDLAQRGLTGEVIANQLLDHLADMEAAAWISSARPSNSYSSS